MRKAFNNIKDGSAALIIALTFKKKIPYLMYERKLKVMDDKLTHSQA